MADDLIEKTKAWLLKEGYPLEYETASKFQEAGFQVFQGNYFQDPVTGKSREQDVIAWVSSQNQSGHLLRVAHVIECKWSADHPWIVFTGSSGIHPAACISQTIASKVGDQFLHKAAHDEELQGWGIFEAPDRPGFGARRAMSQNDDRAFSALQSVVTGAKVHADGYDVRAANRRSMAVIVLPVIVIKGALLLASPDNNGGLELTPATQARLHWKGSDVYPLHATVDIVTVEALSVFLANRFQEVRRLLTKMEPVVDALLRKPR